MPAGPRTVLVVDDDDEIRDMLRELLERHRFQVLLARNGTDALVALRSFRVDLIVLDLAMPEMDGWEFLDVRARRPELAGLPVVVVTANPSPALERDDRVQAVIEKPFHARELVRIVGEWTAGRPRRDSSS